MRSPLRIALLSGGLADQNAQMHADAVRTAGGLYSAPRLRISSTFFRSEKNSGAFQNSDDYWMLWGENEIQALMSLKQLRLAAAIASPTFTANRGYTFNGTTQYLTTGFIPGTHAVAMTGTNLRIAVYERTNITFNSYAAGVTDSAGSNLSIRPRSSGSCFANTNSATVTYTLPVATSAGYMAGGRNGADAAACAAFKNGVAMTQTAATTFGTVLPTRELYIGCLNNAGTPGTFRSCFVGLICVGASLGVAGLELDHYNAVQTIAASVGAQV